ncbi:hypothetical protein ACVW1C_008191 [Bradyrhizobium sp. USDA 4011]
MPAQCFDERRDILDDYHFLVIDLRRRLDGGHVFDDKLVLGSVAECLPKNTVSMTDRPRCDASLAVCSAAVAKSRVPLLDVEGAKLL